MAFRDRSGPMDVDASDPMARLADYALPDDGPARKRECVVHRRRQAVGRWTMGPAPPSDQLTTPGMHADGPGANPFTTPSQTPGFRFGPNTPFLFHAPPLPPAQKFEPYDPTRWARTDFGFGPRAAAVAAEEDVDMSFSLGGAQDSPARPAAAVATAASSASTPAKAAAPKPAPPKAEEEAAAASPERRIATGALTRVRRRRQEWTRRRRYDSDSGDDEVRTTWQWRGVVARASLVAIPTNERRTQTHPLLSHGARSTTTTSTFLRRLCGTRRSLPSSLGQWCRSRG